MPDGATIRIEQRDRFPMDRIRQRRPAFGRPNRSNDTGEGRHSRRALAGTQGNESHEVDPTRQGLLDLPQTHWPQAAPWSKRSTPTRRPCPRLDEGENATPVTVAFDARTPPISNSIPASRRTADASDPADAPPVSVAGEPVRITSTVSPTATPPAGSWPAFVATPTIALPRARPLMHSQLGPAEQSPPEESIRPPYSPHDLTRSAAEIGAKPGEKEILTTARSPRLITCPWGISCATARTATRFPACR